MLSKWAQRVQSNRLYNYITIFLVSVIILGFDTPLYIFILISFFLNMSDVKTEEHLKIISIDSRQYK